MTGDVPAGSLEQGALSGLRQPAVLPQLSWAPLERLLHTGQGEAGF